MSSLLFSPGDSSSDLVQSSSLELQWQLLEQKRKIEQLQEHLAQKCKYYYLSETNILCLSHGTSELRAPRAHT